MKDQALFSCCCKISYPMTWLFQQEVNLEKGLSVASCRRHSKSQDDDDDVSTQESNRFTHPSIVVVHHRVARVKPLQGQVPDMQEYRESLKGGPQVVLNRVKKLRCVYLLQAGERNFFISFSHNLGPTF